MDMTETMRISMRSSPAPYNFVLKEVFSKSLVEHDFDVVGGVPVAVVIEAPGFLENARHFHASWTHEFNIGLRGFVPILECPLLFCLAPEHFIVAVGIKGRVDVNQIHAGVRQFLQLVQVVAAIDYAGVD